MWRLSLWLPYWLGVTLGTPVGTKRVCIFCLRCAAPARGTSHSSSLLISRGLALLGTGSRMLRCWACADTYLPPTLGQSMVSFPSILTKGRGRPEVTGRTQLMPSDLFPERSAQSEGLCLAGDMSEKCNQNQKKGGQIKKSPHFDTIHLLS